MSYTGREHSHRQHDIGSCTVKRCAHRNLADLPAHDQLNHGLAISPDGETIYASNSDTVFSWPYSNITGAVTANATALVSGMGGGDQATRSVLVSQLEPDVIVVSRGSSGAVDQARNQSSGLGQVKAFNVAELPTASGPYDFSADGTLLGWGLYNAVGLAEHPKTGGIFSMDNGQDDLTRYFIMFSEMFHHQEHIDGAKC